VVELTTFDENGPHPTNASVDTQSMTNVIDKRKNLLIVDSLYIPWQILSQEQQTVELKASIYTQSVIKFAAADDIEVPSENMFSLQTLNDKILVHKYILWYTNENKVTTVSMYFT